MLNGVPFIGSITRSGPDHGFTIESGRVGDDPGEQVRREVRDRPHQHAAGASAMADDAAARGVAGAGEGFSRGDEVGEGVELFLALAVEIPAPALLGAAADMVKFAVDAGGADNITVVLIPYLGPETP